MSVASADVHKAIAAAWDAAGLDAVFQALWDSGIVASEFPVLHDGEAAPGQPFPYCVLDQTLSATQVRMSGDGDTVREVRDVTVRFNVHARAVSGDPRTAKQIAADLAEEIMKVFGGHPATAAGSLALDYGDHLITDYVQDYGVRTGHDEYQWVIEYRVRVDVPVAV